MFVTSDYQPLTLSPQYAYSPYSSPYICWGADKENLFNNQELPYMVIISFILMTLMCDSVMIL